MNFIKKQIYWIILILGICLAAEAFSYLGFWAIDHQAISFQKISAEKSILLSGDLGSSQSSKVNAPPVQLNEVFFALHPYLGFVYDPKKNTSANSEFKALPVNDYGFVGKEDLIQKRSQDKVIIGITGGSVAYLFSRIGVDTLREELSRSQYFAGKKIIFISLALGGFKEPQQLMTLTYLLALGAEFDILINIDGFNEIALPVTENIPKKVSPFYPRSWDLRVQNIPDIETQKLVGEITYLKEIRKKWAEKFSNGFYSHSVTMNLIWKIRDLSLSRKITNVQQELQNYRSDNASYNATGYFQEYPNEKEVFENLISIWERCSILLHELCQSKGIKYFHFLQPNQYVSGSKPMTPPEKKVAILDSHPFKKIIETGYPLLQMAGKDLVNQGVFFFDLTQVFSQISEPLYIDNCCHFFEKGNSILAKSIAAKVLENIDSKK